ncbi:MAG: glycoside hydrolase family 113 [Actinomycetes bacterium]
MLGWRASAVTLATAGLVGLTATPPAAESVVSPSPTTATSTRTTSVAPGTQGKVAGFGITTSHGRAKIVSTDAERMAATGVNTVMLETTWVTDEEGSTIARGPGTVSDEELTVAARSAQAAGMSVMLTVKIECTCSFRWRGALRPADYDVFFSEYRAMTNHYAELAERLGVTAFFVGSEMNRVQHAADRWRQVIREARCAEVSGTQCVRPRYTGKVGYQVNWDAMREVNFWDDVDVPGLSAYLPLSDAVAPNVADLLESWRSSTATRWAGTDWVAEIEGLYSDTKKPILFGEIGYQSANQAFQRPWREEKTDAFDPQNQADGYQAALTTFEGRKLWLGAIWWEWKYAGEQDISFSPKGKLAEQLLTAWYDGLRPSSPGQSLVGTTRPSSKGAPVPADSLEGPSSPSGRTTVSRPVPPEPAATTSAPGSAARVGPAQVPAAAATVSPPPLAAEPVPEPTVQIPEALAALPTDTVEKSLKRAAFREQLRRASLLAGFLLLVPMVAHGVLLARRWRSRRPRWVLRG